MKVFFGIFSLAVAVWAAEETVSVVESVSPVVDYHNKFGITQATKIKEAEEIQFKKGGRIIGGSSSSLGQFPYQAGVIITLSQGSTSVCGGSLLSNTKVVTAAHCWYDGFNQARQFEVVLGSVLLFFGGERSTTNRVETHGNWNPWNAANDIALITINHVSYTNNIRPIALPPNDVLNNNFEGETATASGFGKISDWIGISNNAYLSHVQVNVITNTVCAWSYGPYVHTSNICVSGSGIKGTCGGDSGGPLALEYRGETILIGITSYGSDQGCQAGWPSVFARVTSQVPWITARL